MTYRTEIVTYHPVTYDQSDSMGLDVALENQTKRHNYFLIQEVQEITIISCT